MRHRTALRQALTAKPTRHRRDGVSKLGIMRASAARHERLSQTRALQRKALVNTVQAALLAGVTCLAGCVSGTVELCQQHEHHSHVRTAQGARDRRALHGHTDGVSDSSLAKPPLTSPKPHCDQTTRPCAVPHAYRRSSKHQLGRTVRTDVSSAHAALSTHGAWTTDVRLMGTSEMESGTRSSREYARSTTLVSLLRCSFA